MAERIKHLEQQLNKVTTEIDLERSIKVHKEQEKITLLADLQSKSDRIEHLENQVSFLSS